MLSRAPHAPSAYAFRPCPRVRRAGFCLCWTTVPPRKPPLLPIVTLARHRSEMHVPCCVGQDRELQPALTSSTACGCLQLLGLDSFLHASRGGGSQHPNLCEKRGLFGSAPVSYRRTATARRGHLAANRLLARHGRHGASARNRRSLSTQRQESPCKRDWILVGRRRCEPAQGWRLATTAADTDPTPAKPLQPPCAPCGVDVAVAARHLPVAAAALAVAALTIVAVMPFSITHAGLHVAQQGRPALGVCPLAADGAPPSLTTGVPQPTRARACAGSPPRRSCEQRGAARAVCKRAEAATLGGDDRHVRQRCHQRRR